MKGMTVPTRNVIIRHAIDTDVEFAGRFISSLTGAKAVAPVAIFCMFNYLSLFVYESYAQLKQIDPSTVAALTFTADASELLARSRHSLKLFEDSKRGVEGQLEYFSKDVVAAHHRGFIEPVRLPFASVWKADLGLTYYQGRLVTSTFATTFTLGYPPERLFLNGAGETLKGLASEYGEYFSSLGASLDPEATSFATELDSSEVTMKDVRSSPQYRHGFNGAATPSINMLLGTFQGLINTCDLLLGLDRSEASRQTIFKIRYLTVYQVLRSLEILRNDSTMLLTERSHTCIDALLADSMATCLTDPSKKLLRNSLIHYGPDARIDLTSLTFDRPLYGMVEQIFQRDFDDVESRLSGLVKLVAGHLNQWSRESD